MSSRRVSDPCIDDGDTSWVLISTVLVLGMAPALAFFEAGMLRSKNTLSLITQVFSGIITLSVLWFFIGYGLTFGDDVGGVIGNLKYGFMIDVDYFSCREGQTIPHACFALFQMMFANITPLLMTGAYAERMKFKVFLILTVLWEILIYYPVAHWIWGGGFLGTWGVQDFAGGIVIHATAGIGSVVCALKLGRRHEFEEYHGEFPPSSLPLAAIGAGLLWIGWFGFNGGSALRAGSDAVSAIVSTQMACSCSAFVWLMFSWYRGQPSTVALLNGALAGLAGITPASGYIGNAATIVTGFVLGFSSYGACYLLKHKFHIDDALEVSAVHGLTGVIGSLALGIFAEKRFAQSGADGWWFGNPDLFGKQCAGVAVALVYAGVMTYLILILIEWTVGPLRASDEEEKVGLDWSEHQEIAYHRLHVLEDNEQQQPDAFTSVQTEETPTGLAALTRPLNSSPVPLPRSLDYRRQASPTMSPRSPATPVPTLRQ